MRRKDREITDKARILDILDRCEVIRLGFCAADTPYIVPMHFAYATTGGALSLFAHSAGDGRKIEMLRQNNRVCFEADLLHANIPSPEACGWTAHYESVMGEGTVSLLDNHEDKEAALILLLRRYGFTGDARMDAVALQTTAVLRVDVSVLSGKCNFGQRQTRE